MRKVNIGIIGFGNVGSGTAKILLARKSFKSAKGETITSSLSSVSSSRYIRRIQLTSLLSDDSLIALLGKVTSRHFSNAPITSSELNDAL